MSSEITYVVNGAAAGDFLVPGIRTDQALAKVFYLREVQTGATILGINVLTTSSLNVSADIKSEFTVAASGVINNTGGTNTIGGILIVIWNS